jgi:NADPH-dependent glutamate synthase beta subunit-like oxidoreductase
MRKQTEGSRAVAEALAMCRPEVVCASAVGINSVERFLADEALRQGWKVPVDAAPTGKRVLVVGAGPSGLSAAYHLTRLGSHRDAARADLT